MPMLDRGLNDAALRSMMTNPPERGKQIDYFDDPAKGEFAACSSNTATAALSRSTSSGTPRAGARNNTSSVDTLPSSSPSHAMRL
jgi:hypothetical protein